MTKPLSPAAQAVLDAVREICPAPADEIAAVALRAAVAHTQQHHSYTDGHDVWECDADELLTIAAELENNQ
jgi:hypothetical protein